MKRDWFRRGVRMQHQFGETEKRSDPFGTSTFEEAWPKQVRELSGRGIGHRCIQDQGEYNYRAQPSPVQKPNGDLASTNGPAPDIAQDISMPIPVGTKRRMGPLKTDK